MLAFVEKTLAEGGYSLLAGPLIVAGEAFEFDAALVGPDGHGNLILVVVDDGTASPGIVRKVRSLLWLLERTGSLRPVAVVVIASAEAASAFEPISGFAHAISIPPSGDADDAEKALRPLLPLALLPVIQSESVGTLFAAEFGGSLADIRVRSLMSAAKQGPDDVKAALLRLVDLAIGDDLPEVACD